MSEQDQLRAASIFNPKQLNRSARAVRADDAISLWRGNEAYVMFLIERSVTLLSDLPDDEGWLAPYRRNALAYNIDKDELDDEEYVKAVYIRFEGMTNETYSSSVVNFAMNVRQNTPTTVDGELADDTDEDEE